MRLRKRDQRNVFLYPWTGIDEDVYLWGEARVIRAAVYPAESTIIPGICGEAVSEKRLMIYDGHEPLEVGMGVSLDGGTPTLRIVSIEKWAHTRVMLEAISEGRRSDAYGNQNAGA